jgi:hypothetical protein
MTNQEIRAQIDALLDQLVPPVSSSPAPSAPITTPDALDRALSAASIGTVITLDPTLVYPVPLTLKRSVTLQSVSAGVGRMTLTEPAPSFTGGISVTGSDVTLSGLQVTHPDPQHTILDLTGDRVTCDRLRVLGGLQGAKRGIAANGAAISVTRCYVADCWRPSPGDDSQAYCAWDTPGPLLVEDCYLSGGSETLLIGGSDPSSADRIPSDVTIRGCTITKDPTWQTRKIGVKNVLELKNCRRVVIEDNDCSYSWASGQTAYVLMLTCRNQNGTAPYSTIEDVLIQHNRFAHGGAAINILASDDNHPSQRLSRVQIRYNDFSDLDPVQYAGSAAASDKMIQIGVGPVDLTIDSNTFAGVNLKSAVYFYGAPKAERLTYTNNQVPHTKYGVFGAGSTAGLDASGVPHAWTQYVNTGTLRGNVETP